MSKKRPVFTLVLFLIFSLLFGTSIFPAQATKLNTSFSEISITPNTAALGQQVTITGTISPEPLSGYSYHRIQFNVIDINGNYRNIGSNNTQPGTGIFYFSWIPDIRGNYIVNISYPGETLDTGNVYAPCQTSETFFVDPSLPTPTPTLVPATTPEPAPTENNTSTATTESSLYVNCQSSTTYADFKVNIQGTLTSNNSGISDSSILLSYSVDGGNSWIPLTFLITDDTGAFQAVWTPLVTGNYFLRATYEGNSELSPASTIVHFAVLPFEDTSVFSVASNSTVTGLSFNSSSQELSFKVSGETGTTGYAAVYISKSLMNDTSNLKVYLDQELLHPVTQSIDDSWLVSFTYHHSAHTIALALISETSNIQPQTQDSLYIVAGVAGAFLTIGAAILILLKSKAKRKNA